MKKLKDGMQTINWMFIGPKVQAHGMCSVSGCFEKAIYMRESKNGNGKYYKIFCEDHAIEKKTKL